MMMSFSFLNTRSLPKPAGYFAMSPAEFTCNFRRRQGLLREQLIIKLGPNTADILCSKDFYGVTKMARKIAIMALLPLLTGIFGCQAEKSYYMYRPANWEQHHKLMDDWDQASDSPYPLIPTSDPKDAGWVWVSPSGKLLDKGNLPSAPGEYQQCETVYQMLQKGLEGVTATEKMLTEMVNSTMDSVNGSNLTDAIETVGFDWQNGVFFCD